MKMLLLAFSLGIVIACLTLAIIAHGLVWALTVDDPEDAE